MTEKKVIGLTGPSIFTSQCRKMIEKHLNANFVALAQEDPENVRFWLDRCHGVVVAGGVDIHPSIYNKNVIGDRGFTKFDLQRDCQELSIVSYCLERELPMLGICRGHQLIGITLGLGPEFCMDLNTAATVHQPNARNITTNEQDVMHCIKVLLPDEFKIDKVPEREIIYRIMGHENKNTYWVNSFHHQGIVYIDKAEHYKEKGITVIAVASAEWNKKVAIIELMRGKNWISCQFHPEYDYEVNTPSKTVLDLYKSLLEKDTDVNRGVRILRDKGTN